MHETSVDAIVVLGGRVNADGHPAPALARRLQRAAQAFKEGLAPTILTTGGRRWHGHLEAVRMRRYLMSLGVTEQAIELEVFARSTSENAYFCCRMARARGWNRLAVVTCPWHMPRAMGDFHRCGFSPLLLPAEAADATLRHQLYRSAKERTCSILDAFRLSLGSRW